MAFLRSEAIMKTWVKVTGCAKKIDAYQRTVVMQDGTIIPIEDILEIEGFGNKGLEEIKDLLAKYGIELKD